MRRAHVSCISCKFTYNRSFDEGNGFVCPGCGAMLILPSMAYQAIAKVDVSYKKVASGIDNQQSAKEWQQARNRKEIRNILLWIAAGILVIGIYVYFHLQENTTNQTASENVGTTALQPSEPTTISTSIPATSPVRSAPSEPPVASPVATEDATTASDVIIYSGNCIYYKKVIVDGNKYRMEEVSRGPAKVVIDAAQHTFNFYYKEELVCSSSSLESYEDSKEGGEGYSIDTTYTGHLFTAERVFQIYESTPDPTALSMEYDLTNYKVN